MRLFDFFLNAKIKYKHCYPANIDDFGKNKHNRLEYSA